MQRFIVTGEQSMNDYIKKNGNCEMDEICIGFENGLTVEQISVYAGKGFDFKQMCEIRLGFEHGLTINQIKI